MIFNEECWKSSVSWFLLQCPVACGEGRDLDSGVLTNVVDEKIKLEM